MSAFTESEDRIILHMKELQHASWVSIGVRLNRPANVCATRYHMLTEQREKPAIKSVAEIEEARYQGALGELLRARDARNQARTRRDDADALRGVVTAHYLGDPEPGRSALDQRRANA